MLISGTRGFTHNKPITYKRITPDRGCGFILKRIYELTEDPNMPRGTYVKNPTKRDVYRVTPWYNRPGWSSLLWSSLLEDELIESDDGMIKYNGCLSPFSRNYRRYARAAGHVENGKFTVRYHLTSKGRGILFDMMARFNKSTPQLNAVGSVAEHDVKKDWAPKIEDWREDDFLEPGETRDEWMARHGVTPVKAPPTSVERDILEKEAVDCAKLAADYAGENQKLRLEKNDLNERLKNLAERLKNLESEIVSARFTLNSLIDWDK